MKKEDGDSYVYPVLRCNGSIVQALKSKKQKMFKMKSKDWDLILRGTKSRTYEEGEIVIQRGQQKSSRVMLIYSGSCVLLKPQIEKFVTRREESVVEAQGVVGIVGFHTMWEPCDVVAREKSTIYALSQYYVDALCEAYPTLGGRFYAYLCRRTRKLLDSIEQDVLGSSLDIFPRTTKACTRRSCLFHNPDALREEGDSTSKQKSVSNVSDALMVEESSSGGSRIGRPPMSRSESPQRIRGRRASFDSGPTVTATTPAPIRKKIPSSDISKVSPVGPASEPDREHTPRGMSSRGGSDREKGGQGKARSANFCFECGTKVVNFRFCPDCGTHTMLIPLRPGR
mmetsp:Transcript_22789/g.64056  ORF Transcript_22789/g.64056 Transcript_22789/m.64056 type:complete len:341 (+) Transcript_22789:3-1025(+)